jgi:hypothetical protein
VTKCCSAELARLGQARIMPNNPTGSGFEVASYMASSHTGGMRGPAGDRRDTPMARCAGPGGPRASGLTGGHQLAPGSFGLKTSIPIVSSMFRAARNCVRACSRRSRRSHSP